MAELRRQAQQAERGFTLLEVVVAVAILGLVLATALGLLAAGLRAARASTDSTHAVLLAKRQLEALLAQDVTPGIIDGSAQGGYRWTAEVREQGAEAAEAAARLFEVRVRVYWAEKNGREKHLELLTLAAVVEEGKELATMTRRLYARR